MTLLLVIVVLVPGLIVASYPLFIRRKLAEVRPAADNQCSRSISVVVPCRGLEEKQAANIGALLGQKFAGRGEILFCVESADDPVVAVLDSLLATHQDGSARLVITGPAGRDLGKMHNLINGYAEASGDRLIFLDSDVLLPVSDYLERFATGLDAPGVGLVSCYPAYRDFRNIPGALLGFMVNNDLVGLFSLVGARGDLPVANGSCMAVNRSALEASGGLVPLRRQLLMDTALARNILKAGFKVRLHDEGAPVLAGHMTLAEACGQSRRWHMAMWRVLPRIHYIGYAWLRGGILLGLVGWFLMGMAPILAAALVFTLASRFLTAWRLDRDYLRSGSFFRYCWLLPVVELVNGWEVLTAPLGSHIDWRGRSYVLDNRGQATPGTSANAQGKGN
jgi:cellulose synthase/poly-beta-1,6-N-acetylglucosamine synthase-like glycosyltransferase